MPYKFWMVYNPGRKEPTHSHATRTLAHEEAKRLATKHPGERFCVMESLYECVTTAPTVDTVVHSVAPTVAAP